MTMKTIFLFFFFGATNLASVTAEIVATRFHFLHSQPTTLRGYLYVPMQEQYIPDVRTKTFSRSLADRCDEGAILDSVMYVPYPCTDSSCGCGTPDPANPPQNPACSIQQLPSPAQGYVNVNVPFDIANWNEVLKWYRESENDSVRTHK